MKLHQQSPRMKQVTCRDGVIEATLVRHPICKA